MGQAGVVNRPGQEGQLEGAVGIFIGNVKKLRACLLVLKGHQGCADQVKGTKLLDFEAFDHVAHGGQAGRFGSA